MDDWNIHVNMGRKFEISERLFNAYKVKLVASKQNPIVLLDDHGGRKIVTFLAKDLHISCLISKKNGGVLQ